MGYQNTFLPQVWFALPADLRSKFNYLTDIHLSYNWSKELTIRIQRDEAVAMITTEKLSSTSRYFRITSSGVLIDELDVSGQPIYYADVISTAIGSTIKSDQRWVVELLDKLTFDGFVVEAKDDDRYTILKLSKSNKFLNLQLIPNQKPINQIRDWTRILINDDQIDTNSVINMTFDNPVLVF